MRELFRAVQVETCKRYPAVTFTAGCLMSNHAHLVLQSSGPASQISQAIQYLASRFALGLNRIAGRQGPVFRDRFFSRVLNSVSELVRALKYVGMNPVKAGLCQRPEGWAGSWLASLLGGGASMGTWTWRGWKYRVLGFNSGAREAIRKILAGEIRPRSPGRSRQNRLPFARGLPVRASARV